MWCWILATALSKFSKVKGDRTKIKQILCNLLNNAVKFTSEGHAVVRAWAKKPDSDNPIFSSNRNSPLHCVPCLFFKKDEAENGQISMKQFKKIPIVWNSYSRWMIPGKEYRMRSKILVFENYVQVRETSTDHTQEGTGLGLGNVQSLVHLTSSEIGIVDKEIGEKGTCFRTSSLLHAKLTRPISMPEKTI